MRRTFIGLVCNDPGVTETAAIYLGRRGFKHFGDVHTFESALAHKDRLHGLMHPVRTMEELAWLQRDAGEHCIKLVVFGIRNTRDPTFGMPPHIMQADNVLTFAGNLEGFYRQLDSFMENIFE